MLNLDYYCMKYGQMIGNIRANGNPKNNKEHLNNLRKALGVLKEDGVYAMFLWLEDKDNGEVRRRGLLPLLNGEKDIKKLFLGEKESFPDNFEGMCAKMQQIAASLEKLLLLKKILERTLTYALYHAKVKAGEE